MAFSLKVNKDKAALRDIGSGPSFIATSGVYDVTVNFVSLDETDKGAVRFNMNVNYKGNDQAIYGSIIMNKDGGENKIGKELINKLLVVAGLEAGAEPTIDTETHKVGKDNKEQEFTVITDLSGLDIKIQVKEEFKKFEGKVTRSLVPYNFFRADGATAAEIAQSEEDKSVKFGEQLAKVLAMEATTKPSYRADGANAAPTEDEVKAYFAEKSGKAPAAATVAVPKKNPFKK